jgi:hypothetical protein
VSDRPLLSQNDLGVETRLRHHIADAPRVAIEFDLGSDLSGDHPSASLGCGSIRPSRQRSSSRYAGAITSTRNGTGAPSRHQREVVTKANRGTHRRGPLYPLWLVAKRPASWLTAR